MIPFNRASFEGNELAHLSEAIQIGHVSGNGPNTRQVEQILTDIHGSGRSLMTTSCTHSLEIAALLLRLTPEDEVIVPSYTFVSTAAAFLLHGGTPVFVDVRDDTLNISIEAVEAAITPRTKAICIVHYAGIAADPERFCELADRHGLVLIEDNAHGLFARYRGRNLGTFGAMSTMSFHETKNVTCGEGGALHLNDQQFLERAEILREKGTDRSKFFRGQIDKYTWVDVGSSWVASDLLAGVLLGQLERYREIQHRREVVWNRYDIALKEWSMSNNVRTPVVPADCEHSSHMYHLRFGDLDTRTRFIAHMRNHDVMTVFHYQPLHLSAIGVQLGGRVGQCPVAEEASDTLVRLPLFASITDSQIDQVLNAALAFGL
ncbi:MAG: hypothetical protein RIR69_1589 [Actinomycetota bacterium]